MSTIALWKNKVMLMVVGTVTATLQVIGNWNNLNFGWYVYDLSSTSTTTASVFSTPFTRNAASASIELDNWIDPTTLTADQKLLLNRTAIVWVTIGITTECEATRLRHLVETSPPEMDVWVLHAHHKLQEEDAVASQDYLRRIPRVQQWEQKESPKFLFDLGSGTSKSSFLSFLKHHKELYDYGWLIENDSFFTGSWDQLFVGEATQPTQYDFLTTKIQSQKNRNWYWVTQQECKILKQPCNQLDPNVTQVHWITARISTQLARAMLKGIYYRNLVGLHEAVTMGFIQAANFTISRISEYRLGDFKAGHVKKKQNATNNSPQLQFTVGAKNPSPFQLIHPVKCSAYSNNNNSTTITTTTTTTTTTTVVNSNNTSSNQTTSETTTSTTTSTNTITTSTMENEIDKWIQYTKQFTTSNNNQ